VADTLLIHYSTAEPANATWSTVNNAGELTSMVTHGPLSDAAVIAEKNKVVVLLDNTELHLSTLNLPVKNQAKLLRALPFAMEEMIADDIDDMHFVASKPKADGTVAAAAIKHETLKNIIATFNDAGIYPETIIPDALCLTANSEQWAILLQEDHANVQFDTLSGGEFDSDSLSLLLSAKLQQDDQPNPEKIILFTPEGDDSDPENNIAATIAASLPEEIELMNISYNTHPLVVYCGQYKNAMPLNLLQGSYKPSQKGNVDWRRWRLAAALALIWITLDLGSTSVQYFELQDKNEVLSAKIEKIYKSAFPKSRKIVNARVQMEQKLKELKSGGSGSAGGSIVELLSNTASALSDADKLTLQAVNYRNNKLDLELTGTNLQAIEDLNKSLNTGNLKAEIISSSSDKNKVKGNIRVQKAES
jgi:general secretion pathway protein L